MPHAMCSSLHLDDVSAAGPKMVAPQSGNILHLVCTDRNGNIKWDPMKEKNPIGLVKLFWAYIYINSVII